MAIIVGVLLVMAGLFAGAFPLLKQNADRTVCKRNLNAINKALQVYMVDNNDRFPPAFAEAAPGVPLLVQGHPFTWMSLIYDALPERASFLCPTVPRELATINAAPSAEGVAFASSYGMYAPRAGNTSQFVANDDAILVSETMPAGLSDTANPVPLKDSDGNPIRDDGFLIGWNTSNESPEGAQYVTRLAFSGSKGGKLDSGLSGRHGQDIYALTVGGQLVLLKSPEAEIQRLGSELVGRWSDEGSWRLRRPRR